jgi:hypothetical protein
MYEKEQEINNLSKNISPDSFLSSSSKSSSSSELSIDSDKGTEVYQNVRALTFDLFKVSF